MSANIKVCDNCDAKGCGACDFSGYLPVSDADYAIENPVEFRVENHGTVWTFTALTDDAWRFVRDELPLESWQITGRYSFAVDHRPAQQLVRDLSDRGFRVEGK